MIKDNYTDKLSFLNLTNRQLDYRNIDNDKTISKLHNGCYQGNIHYINELRTLTKIYIKKNLEISGLKIDKIENNFLKKYETNICKILTLSKNGAIYPKDETQLIYNLIVDYVFKSIASILPYIEKINYPTIRFKTKTKSLNLFSTEILHSDAWSSGSMSDAVISLPILGDIKNNCVDFYVSNKVKKKFFVEQKNYNNTKHLYDQIIKIYSLKEKKWVLFDHSILHRTRTSKNCAPRISIDMIVKIKKNKNLKKNYTKNFYSTKNFEDIGIKTFIKSMENYNQLFKRIKSKKKKIISQKLTKI